jgi:DNA-binding response OmpR family regulator
MASPRDSGSPRDRILIVEKDPAISDLIGRQALQAVGYQVQVSTDAGTAITRALQWAPDLILLDLDLPGLSGKDLMVALASQGVQTPLIVLARRGMEADLIQTFRLGAADYLLLPAREAEVVNAVTRVLKQVHERRERERLAQKLQQTNNELQARVRELTTIFALGKAMTSVTDQNTLLEKVLDAGVRITQADLAWFLLREDTDRPFIVAAQHNLPDSLGVRLNQPWDDGVSSLVAMSGETLAIHGDPLRRFKISALGMSALIVPVKVQKKVIGLLAMMRSSDAAFSISDQHLLTALADYASISLVNARLFRTVEERARSLQRVVESAALNDRVKNEMLRLVSQEITTPLQTARASLDTLARDPLARWRPEQRQTLMSAADSMQRALEVVVVVSPRKPSGGAPEHGRFKLNDLVRESLRRMQPYAHRRGVQLFPELPGEALSVIADGGLLASALEGALAYVIHHSPSGGQVTLHLERDGDEAKLCLRHSGACLSPAELEMAFEEKTAEKASSAASQPAYSGPGIHLPLVREIILRHGGRAWLESQPPAGASVWMRLPLAR